MPEQAYRVEKDSLGEVRVPADALYQAQTQRAVDNFPISGLRFGRPFIRALGIIKSAAAAVSAELGVLDAKLASVIEQAAAEVAAGQHDNHFPVIGYDKAAEIGKQAYREGRKISEVAAEKTSLSRAEIDKLLNPRELTAGGIKGTLSSG
jgi:fumarate hydratase class II